MGRMTIDNSKEGFKQVLMKSIQTDDLTVNYLITERYKNAYSGKVNNNHFYFYFHYDKGEMNIKNLIKTWKERFVPTCLYGEILEENNKVEIIYTIKIRVSKGT